MKSRQTYQGKFRPLNPKKYKGNFQNIIYRSSWELEFMSFLDKNDSILEWNSEEIAIPYKSPIDRKVHRYFPDFWIKRKTKDGKVEELIVEIKPYSEIFAPVRSKKKKMQVYMTEVMTYTVNQAKWKSACKYCHNKGYQFVVITKDNKEKFQMLNEEQLKLKDEII